MRKKLPIGIDGFEKIRTNNFYYVDKTMFIAELLQNWGEVNLFTRPRRFGKTLNLSMLKCFFEIGGRQELFDGLKISQEKELIEEYMGQFPVISVSLKSVDGLSFEAASAALRNIVGKEASRFQFLRESVRLSENERERYEALIRVDQGVFAMNDELLVDGLLTLSQLLSKHYDRKIILLIDEYDVPLDKAFQAGYYDRMVSLIRNMLGNVLKTNDALFFAVLTGCLRISKESIFTGLNNLKVHTVSDSRYDEYFGFTDADVSDLLDFYDLSSYKDIMKDWYDGYLFGKINVYCPWDVINYCDTLLSDEDAEPENYWANTSGNDIVRRLLKKADQTTKNEVEQLLNNKYIVKSVRQELTYRDIDSSVDNIWSVLYSTGYLTQCGRLPGKQLKLIIPNREVHELFTDLVKEWFQEKTLSDSAKIHRFCRAFPAGEVDMIQNMLHDYLWDSISIRDTAVRMDRKENFYHGMILGLLRSQENWLIKSNAETGEGYSDISIYTPEHIGIVIELKYAHDGNLEKACAKALQQIREKKYAVGLRRKGMERIITYGIAFYEKECMVVSGLQEKMS
ncbi:AAA family ATPase [Eubacterium sp. An3]|uniref:AAA family ATPase n=1 Tax=Eubacterium sp. An3 TaxID=1965628 RepID=UPI000B39C540|nr:AAA family ATPase [Eubacterium sp. An3]OUO27293.1 hypothetical protein B5F87_10940 [Eubacterium sp. An3]